MASVCSSDGVLVNIPQFVLDKSDVLHKIIFGCEGLKGSVTMQVRSRVLNAICDFYSGNYRNFYVGVGRCTGEKVFRDHVEERYKISNKMLNEIKAVCDFLMLEDLYQYALHVETKQAERGQFHCIARERCQEDVWPISGKVQESDDVTIGEDELTIYDRFKTGKAKDKLWVWPHEVDGGDPRDEDLMWEEEEEDDIQQGWSCTYYDDKKEEWYCHSTSECYYFEYYDDKYGEKRV